MAKLEVSVVIRRPVEEVFSFLVNPANFTKWESGITESNQISECPIGVGTTMREVGSFLGRKVETILKFTEYEPNRKFSMASTSGSIPMQGTYTFDPVEGGTKVTMIGEAQFRGFFKLIEPIYIFMGKRQLEADHKKLKNLLEAQP